MTNQTLYVLAIDSADEYRATLHATIGAAEAALRDWAFAADHDLDEADELRNLHGVSLHEYLQDRGVENNITTAELPWSVIAVDRELVERAQLWQRSEAPVCIHDLAVHLANSNKEV